MISPRLLCLLICAYAVHCFSAHAEMDADDTTAVETDADSDHDAAWRRELDKRLQRQVTFNFQDTALTDAITFLQQISRFNLIVDPELAADKTVTLSVNNATVKEALASIFAKLNADYLIIDEAIFYFPKGKYALRKPVPPPALSPDALKTFEAALPALRAAEFPTREKASQQLKALGAGVVPPVKAALQTEVDPEAQQRLGRIVEAFRPAGSLNDLTAETARQLRAQNRPITFEFQQTPLEDAVVTFSQLSRTNVSADPAVGKHAVTLRVNAMTIGNILKWIARLSDSQIAATGDGFKFTSKPAAEPAEKPAVPEAKK